MHSAARWQVPVTELNARIPVEVGLGRVPQNGRLVGQLQRTRGAPPSGTSDDPHPGSGFRVWDGPAEVGEGQFRVH